MASGKTGPDEPAGLHQTLRQFDSLIVRAVCSQKLPAYSNQEFAIRDGRKDPFGVPDEQGHPDVNRPARRDWQA